jgi:hypothetical protein
VEGEEFDQFDHGKCAARVWPSASRRSSAG